MAEPFPTVVRAVVGRQRELRDTRAAIAAGLGGAGGLLVVTGEAGIGKTRLVEELVADVSTEDGGRVLWGVCAEDPGTPSFWPWTAILEECAASAGLPLGEDLAPRLGGAEADGPPDQLRLRLFDAASALVRTAADLQPLLIVVEDLQLARPPTLMLLRHLATGLRGHPAMLVATSRPPEHSAQPARSLALEDLSRIARTLPLLGLPPDATSELMQATVGEPASPRLVARVHERTGGNPLFVIEVAKLLAAQGRSDAEQLPIPSSVRHVIAERLALLGQPVLAVLVDASVIGVEFSSAVLEHMRDQPAATSIDLLSEAVSARLVHPVPGVDRFRFTHGLVRDVLYDGLPGAERRRRHRKVATALEDRHRGDLDDHAVELADHYLLALPEVDPGRTVEYARRAGEHALAALAYEEAARYLARATDLAGPAGLDDATRVDLLLALGDARMRAGDWPGATATLEKAAALARTRRRPDELARAALGLGAGLSGFEVRLFEQRQIAVLREALAQLDDGQLELRARVLARLSVAESFEADERVRLERSREAVEVARRLGDQRLLVYALSSYCDAIAGPDHVEERLSVATEMVALGRRTGDLEGELLGRRFRLVASLESGDIGGVDTEIEAFARGVARLRWPLIAWYPTMWRGMRANIEGRLADAERAAEQVRAIGQPAGSVNAGILADLLDLQRLLEAGRPHDAYRLLGRFLDHPEGGPNAEAWRALPLARMGHTAEARAVLDRLAAADFPLVVDGAWLEVIASVAEAAAELGHRDGAERLLPLLGPYAGRFATGGIGTACFGSISRHLGRLSHCVGRLDDAVEYFRQAMAAHRRAGAAMLIAHTQHQFAAVLRDRSSPGDRAEATAMLAAAAEAYRQLGLDHLVGASTAAATVAVEAGNALEREGEVWRVRYDGRETRVRHLKGLAVLARLLAEPHREFHVRDLVALGDPLSTAVLAAGDSGPVLDDRAREVYRMRLADLEAEIDDATAAADTVRAERSRAERDALVEQLTHAYGLAGRPRRVDDPVERARWAVTKQVRVAIQRIGEGHPGLGQHLQNSIRTGRFCSYTPEHPVRWRC